MAKKSRKPRRDLYQEVTDKILAHLDRGVAPWRHPIVGRGGAGFPHNLSTDKRYRGVNVFLLAMEAWFEGYGSGAWLTYKQCQAMGGQVRKGERASLVTFWKVYEKQDQDSGEVTRLPCLKHYNVFNAEQCDGIDGPEQNGEQATIDFEPLAEAEKVVAGYQDPPQIVHGGKSACYYPDIDHIKIAPPERFVKPEAYYATLYHELTHSSGHPKRLDRENDGRRHEFGTPEYSREELVAEFGSAFLAAAAGISPPTIEQSAAYIDGWRKKLRGDKKLVIQAAGQGQRAADYILGVTFEEAAESGTEAPTDSACVENSGEPSALKGGQPEPF